MRTARLLSEGVKVNTELIVPTSAAGATSANYDMQNYDKALILAHADGNYTEVTLDLMESSAATAAGSSAAGSKVGIVLGSSVTTAISTARGVREVLLTVGTAGTGTTGMPFTMKVGGVQKSFYFSTSTALHNSSAWSSTKIYVGSTVGSTVITGAQLTAGMLSSALMNSTYGFGSQIVCATVATNTLTARLTDVDENIGFGSTDGDWVSAAVQSAVGGFNVSADEMTSTANKRYLSVKASTAATSVQVGITVVRGPGRYNNGKFPANLSTVNFST